MPLFLYGITIILLAGKLRLGAISQLAAVWLLTVKTELGLPKNMLRVLLVLPLRVVLVNAINRISTAVSAEVPLNILAMVVTLRVVQEDMLMVVMEMEFWNIPDILVTFAVFQPDKFSVPPFCVRAEVLWNMPCMFVTLAVLKPSIPMMVCNLLAP